MTNSQTTHCHMVLSHIIILRETTSLTQQRNLWRLPCRAREGRGKLWVGVALRNSPEGDAGIFLKDRRPALGPLACSVGPSELSEKWNWMVPDSTCFTCD